MKPIDILKSTQKIDNELAKMEWYNNLSNDYKESVKNSILGLYNYLSDEEHKKIFLEILKNIVIINIDEYEELVINCYRQLRNKYKNIKKIIIQPLQAENEKIKSGTFVSYLFNSHKLARVDEKYNFTTIPIVIKNQLSSNDNNRETLVVLVDDFVGSGNSAKRCIKKYKKNNPVIVALTCLTEGYQRIKDINIPIIYGKK
ncbi:phosphoribosyltransferase [Staphylococcus epidermidis]